MANGIFGLLANSSPHSCADWASFFMSQLTSSILCPATPPLALTYCTAACASVRMPGKEVVPVSMFAKPIWITLPLAPAPAACAAEELAGVDGGVLVVELPLLLQAPRARVANAAPAAATYLDFDRCTLVLLLLVLATARCRTRAVGGVPCPSLRTTSEPRRDRAR